MKKKVLKPGSVDGRPKGVNDPMKLYSVRVPELVYRQLKGVGSDAQRALIKTGLEISKDIKT